MPQRDRVLAVDVQSGDVGPIRIAHGDRVRAGGQRQPASGGRCPSAGRRLDPPPGLMRAARPRRAFDETRLARRRWPALALPPRSMRAPQWLPRRRQSRRHRALRHGARGSDGGARRGAAAVPAPRHGATGDRSRRSPARAACSPRPSRRRWLVVRMDFITTRPPARLSAATQRAGDALGRRLALAREPFITRTRRRSDPVAQLHRQVACRRSAGQDRAPSRGPRSSGERHARVRGARARSSALHGALDLVRRRSNGHARGARARRHE